EIAIDGVAELDRVGAVEMDAVPGNLDALAEEARRLQQLVGLVGSDQRVELGVGVDLLLDLAELDELRGELGRVLRRQRVLVLQLRRQQREELVEGLADAERILRRRAARACRGTGAAGRRDIAGG